MAANLMEAASAQKAVEADWPVSSASTACATSRRFRMGRRCTKPGRAVEADDGSECRHRAEHGAGGGAGHAGRRPPARSSTSRPAAASRAAPAWRHSASKSAVIRLTESMSAELRDAGINVNCVLPSVIDTPQNRRRYAQGRSEEMGLAARPRQRDAVLCSALPAPSTGPPFPVNGLLKTKTKTPVILSAAKDLAGSCAAAANPSLALRMTIKNGER